jgi:hypothetical protein
MPAVFISYRRDDTVSATGRLADALATRFGPEEIFRDIQAIDAGADFRDVLRDALRTAQVVVVVIGRFWPGTRGASTPSRLHDPGDYVRMEIEEALTHDVHIVPVLVEGVPMPGRAEAPQSIRPLATVMRTDLRFAMGPASIGWSNCWRSTPASRHAPGAALAMVGC